MHKYLTNFINQSQSLVAIKNLRSEYIYANQAVADHFGYQRPEQIVEPGLRDEHIRSPCSELAEEFYLEDRKAIESKKTLKILLLVKVR